MPGIAAALLSDTVSGRPPADHSQSEPEGYGMASGCEDVDGALMRYLNCIVLGVSTGFTSSANCKGYTSFHREVSGSCPSTSLVKYETDPQKSRCLPHSLCCNAFNSRVLYECSTWNMHPCTLAQQCTRCPTAVEWRAPEAPVP